MTKLTVTILFMFMLSLMNIVPVFAVTLITAGNYVYSVAPNEGPSPDNGNDGLISFSSGAMTDSADSTVSWKGDGTGYVTVSIVFDLLKDYPLDNVTVTSNSPNEWYGVKSILVKYRQNSANSYTVLKAQDWYGTSNPMPASSPNNSLSFYASNAYARFVIVQITRVNTWQYMPVTNVQCYQGTGTPSSQYAALNATQLRAEADMPTKTVDKYGQCTYEEWPGKVTSDSQLQQEYTTEAASLANVSLNTQVYDQYGGIKAPGNYGGTGYFRFQKVDGKWWFVSPAGYLFFLKGVDTSSINEWGYTTRYKNLDGTDRDIFNELPDPVTYAAAYDDSNPGWTDNTVSFLKTNIMKKYGSNYTAAATDLLKKRLINWGFNALSNGQEIPAWACRTSNIWRLPPTVSGWIPAAEARGSWTPSTPISRARYKIPTALL